MSLDNDGSGVSCRKSSTGIRIAFFYTFFILLQLIEQGKTKCNVPLNHTLKIKVIWEQNHILETASHFYASD